MGMLPAVLLNVQQHWWPDAVMLVWCDSLQWRCCDAAGVEVVPHSAMGLGVGFVEGTKGL